MKLTASQACLQELPRILAPQGYVTTSSPAVEWEGSLLPGPDRPIEVQLRLTRKPNPEQDVLWESELILVNRERIEPGVLRLPAREPVYLWIREHRFHGMYWQPWNPLPTLLYYCPLAAGPKEICVYDLRPTRQMSPERAFAEAHLAAALQGIVNRGAPRLFLRFLDIDSWWLDELRQPEHWLAGAKIQEIATLEELIKRFRGEIKGAVVWDRKVDATSNLASTIAGVENLLPVYEDASEGSLWRRIIEGGLKLSVVRDLRGMFTGKGCIPGSSTPSSGSAKCDAYLWAKEQYLDSGRCDGGYLGYYIDAYWIKDPAPGKDFSNHTLTNHDYFIANKGFMWDLNVWEDESPVDDPRQAPGTDYRTLIEILRSARRNAAGERTITIGGFNPWAFKYTTNQGAGGTHDGVQTEWETVRIATQFDAQIDADALHLAGMANASFYKHFPLPDYLIQGPAPTPAEVRRQGFIDDEGRVEPKNYVFHYVGDYDSAAWACSQIPPKWNVPGRGEALISWAINPNLADRAAPLFEYLYRTRTARDSFQGADSGAGYVNPTGLFAPRSTSNLPAGAAQWERRCAKYYRRHNLTVTGFIINARSGRMTAEAEQLFASFSPDGVCVRDPHAGIHLEGNLPVIPMRNEGLPDWGSYEAARIIVNYEGPADESCEGPGAAPRHPSFISCRSVLCPSTYYKELEESLKRLRPGGSFAIVEPRTFFYLMRSWLGGHNERRATWLFDTLPFPVIQGREVKFALGIRNDGWDVWRASGPEAVQAAVEFSCDGARRNPTFFQLPADVPPGASVLIPVEVLAPTKSGCAFLRAELRKGSAQWFTDGGSLPLIIEAEAMDITEG